MTPLSISLINETVGWFLVPDRLDSSKWGGVSLTASSPERAQCQNLCSLLDCFVLWNNAALISPVGARAPISLTGKKWRLHFLPQPAARLSWPACMRHACLQTRSSLLSLPAAPSVRGSEAMQRSTLGPRRWEKAAPPYSLAVST